MKDLKKLIYSKYWGQNRLGYEDDKEPEYIIDSHNIDCNCMKLFVKKLKWIDEDECRVLGRILGLTFDKPGYITFASFRKTFTDDDIEGYRCLFHLFDLTPAYEYLRAMGYLLPILYLDKNNQIKELKPDEIVSMGIATYWNGETVHLPF